MPLLILIMEKGNHRYNDRNEPCSWQIHEIMCDTENKSENISLFTRHLINPKRDENLLDPNVDIPKTSTFKRRVLLMKVVDINFSIIWPKTSTFKRRVLPMKVVDINFSIIWPKTSTFKRRVLPMKVVDINFSIIWPKTSTFKRRVLPMKVVDINFSIIWPKTSTFKRRVLPMKVVDINFSIIWNVSEKMSCLFFEGFVVVSCYIQFVDVYVDASSHKTLSDGQLSDGQPNTYLWFKILIMSIIFIFPFLW